jgi:hypothetical protein
VPGKEGALGDGGEFHPQKLWGPCPLLPEDSKKEAGVNKERRVFMEQQLRVHRGSGKLGVVLWMVMEAKFHNPSPWGKEDGMSLILQTVLWCPGDDIWICVAAPRDSRGEH